MRSTTDIAATQRRRRRRRVGNPLSRRTLHHSDWLLRHGSWIVLIVLVVLAIALYGLVIRPARHSPPPSSLEKAAVVATNNAGRLRSGGKDNSEGEATKPGQAVQALEGMARHEETHPNDAAQILVLTLAHDIGKLEIRLRPDLSTESADYVQRLVSDAAKDGCPRCQFYRAEKPGILQGILESPQVATVTQRGPCPPGAEHIPNDCPAWDKDCGCHGPLMTTGMVGWAGGHTGPDFFINAYAHVVPNWGTQHTVWGELLPSSLALMERIWKLPVHRQPSGMTMLVEPLKFTVSLETAVSQ